MAYPDLSRIKHAHIRRRVQWEIMPGRVWNTFLGMLLGAVFSGLVSLPGALVLAFLKHMFDSPYRAAQVPFSQYYWMAFGICMVGWGLFYLSHGGDIADDAHDHIRKGYADDAELTRQENEARARAEWERTKPERDAAAHRSQEEHNRKQELLRLERERAASLVRFHDAELAARGTPERREKEEQQALDFLKNEFANYAMVLRLQGVMAPAEIARRFTEEQLSIVIVTAPVNMGVLRHPALALPDIYKPMLAFLPPLPPAPYLPSEKSLREIMAAKKRLS